MTNELIEGKLISRADLLSLHPSMPAIRSLSPIKHQEDSNQAMARHIAALNLLNILDKFEVDWTEDMSNELVKYNGHETVCYYLE